MRWSFLHQRRLGSLGIRARILLVVMIPVVALLACTTVIAIQFRSDAIAARSTQRATKALALAQSLQTALGREYEREMIIAATTNLEGYPQEYRSKVERDAQLAQPRKLRQRTNRALAAMTAAQRPFTRHQLDVARAEQGSTELLGQLDTAATELRNRLIARAIETLPSTGSQDLTELLHAIETISGARASVRPSSSAMAQIWFPRESGPTIDRLELAQAVTLYHDTKSALADITDPTLRTSIDALEFPDRMMSALTHELFPEHGEAIDDMNERFAVLVDMIVYDNALQQVPATAAQLALDRAAQAADSADSQASLALAAGILIAALAVAAVIYVSLTILNPVTTLTESVRRVGEGDLSVDPIPERGPAELARAGSAFNTVIENLSHLEYTVTAMANLEFDDPILERRPLGKLSSTLAHSIHLLSGTIRSRSELEEKLNYESHHDRLTGLANRTAALGALTSALGRARRKGTTLAVYLFDFDGFKDANERLGHEQGDCVLRETAQRLQDTIRSGDTAARLGSDEFFVIAEDLADIAAVMELGQRIVAALSEPFDVGDDTLRLAVSMGIGLDQDHTDTAMSLLGKADLASSRAKTRVGNAIELFDDRLQRELEHRAEIESSLAATLARDGDELELHYQPIIDTDKNSIGSLEALIRWRRDGTLVPPDDFIPIAERSELIVVLDQWVLTQAIRQLQAWSTHPLLGRATVAVNISGRHITESFFVDDVLDTLARFEVDPRRLIVEVTETVLVEDLNQAAEALGRIREAGVRVAVDDFGTGYTSLTQLRMLPVDEIKIDRSFIAQLPDSKEISLIQIVNDLARHLGVSTVAEGVESQSQADTLASLGCDALQGYLFTRPLPVADVEAWAQALDDAPSEIGGPHAA